MGRNSSLTIGVDYSGAVSRTRRFVSQPAAKDKNDHETTRGNLREICSDLNLSVSGVAVNVVADEGISVATDLAIPLVLIANELITNAVKYAYPERTNGKVQVVLVRKGKDHIVLTVADDGVGMPPNFDPRAGKSLGMRIVRAFAGQLNAEFSVEARKPGAQFILLVPLKPPT